MRQDINSADLKPLVVGDLADKVNRNLTFTAYDVTKSLRDANPGLNILNDDVRGLVHETMLGAPGYDRQLQDYSGISAWTYFSTQFPTGSNTPVLAPGQPIVVTPPQMLTSAGTLSWLPQPIPDDDDTDADDE